MSAWVPFTLEGFAHALPVDFLSQYAVWTMANPEKGNRMAEIVAEVVNQFRSTVRCNPRNVLGVDENTVPAVGYSYAFAIAAFTLGLEMGLVSAGAVQGAAMVNVVVTSASSDGGKPIANALSSGSAAVGLNFLDAMSRLVLRGEVWLRMVQSGLLPVLGDEPFGTPSYRKGGGFGVQGRRGEATANERE